MLDCDNLITMSTLPVADIPTANEIIPDSSDTEKANEIIPDSSDTEKENSIRKFDLKILRDSFVNCIQSENTLLISEYVRAYEELCV